MKLYYFPGACALACHIALEWTGAAYQTVRLSQASTKSADYLQINHEGTVPLLEHEGKTLTETAAILFYIAEKYPHTSLLGASDAYGRADVIRWVSYLGSELHPTFRQIFHPRRFIDSRDGILAITSKAKDAIRARLSRIDQHLGGKSWLAESRSIADAYLLVILRWAESVSLPTNGLTNLMEFKARMLEDEAVVAAITSEEGRRSGPETLS